MVRSGNPAAASASRRITVCLFLVGPPASYRGDQRIHLLLGGAVFGADDFCELLLEDGIGLDLLPRLPRQEQPQTQERHRP